MPTDTNADTDTDDTVLFLLTPPEDLWRDWEADTPHDATPQERLQTLLEYDAEHDLDGLVGLAGDADSIPVEMMRIRHRCMSGIQDARANGADDAAEALKEIQAAASGILEGE